MSTVKVEAIKMIKNLPDTISWDDLMYEFYLHKKIEKGINAITEGKVVSHDESKQKFLNR